MKRAFVFGGSGYSGLELLRWLAGHPAVEVAGSSSDKWQGIAVAARVAGFTGALRFETHDQLFRRAEPGGIAFLATPAETSLELAPELISRGLSVIDLSGAFRLRAAEAYKPWYGFEHPKSGLLETARYGLPELFPTGGALVQGTAQTRLIANPGCYATAAILAVAPLVAADLIDRTRPIIMDGKSGTTGAGRKADESLLFSEVADSIRPYRLAAHQHTPEIEQALGWLAAPREAPQVSFTAHLIPIRRGLLVSAYAAARPSVTQAAIDETYRVHYERHAFVRVLGNRAVEPGPVAFSNYCDVAARLDVRTGTILAFGALDNLVKGASGQAIQNMNAVLGLPLETGLLARVGRASAKKEEP